MTASQKEQVNSITNLKIYMHFKVMHNSEDGCKLSFSAGLLNANMWYMKTENIILEREGQMEGGTYKVPVS